MSTITTKSSSLPRAYIGARRNRHYINNNLTSSSLSNDYFPSTTSSSSQSFQPIQSKQKKYLSNTETADALQIQQEERAPVKYFSATAPLDERQLNLQQEQKAKGFFPSSSSSSLFLFPTAHNATPLSTDYDHFSPSSFADEQQHSSLQYEPHSNEQLFNTENKNNSFLLLDKFDQQKQKHLLTSSQYFDLSDVPEENTSFSSVYSLNDTIVDNNDNDNQSHILTSTPILPSHSSYQHRTTNNNIFASLSTEKHNSNKPLPLTLDSTDEPSSTISTGDLITDLQHKADVCQLNTMSSSLSSSLRYSSNLGTHPYDQRISDQGNKYIIQLKTDEFQENDFILTPRYSLNQLIIEAKHREEDITGGYIHRELRKIFNIPKHINIHRYTYSYNSQTQELLIELPYLQTSSITNENRNDTTYFSPTRNTIESSNYSYGKLNRNIGEPISSIRTDYHNDSNNTSGIGTIATDSTLTRSSNTVVPPIYESSFSKTKPFDFDLFHRSVFRPQIIRATTNDNNNNNEKKLLMSLDLSDYQAEDIKVSIKDRELIVKAERKVETDTRKSRTSFFQSTTLPPQTDIEHLQSNYNDGKLIIEAPYLEQNTTTQKIQSTTSSNNNTKNNWQIVSESEQNTTIEDPFQHRKELMTEFICRRRV